MDQMETRFGFKRQSIEYYDDNNDDEDHHDDDNATRNERNNDDNDYDGRYWKPLDERAVERFQGSCLKVRDAEMFDNYYCDDESSNDDFEIAKEGYNQQQEDDHNNNTNRNDDGFFEDNGGNNNDDVVVVDDDDDDDLDIIPTISSGARIADRLFSCLEAGDFSSAADLFSPDAIIINYAESSTDNDDRGTSSKKKKRDPIQQHPFLSVAELESRLIALVANVGAPPKYLNRRITAFEGGFVQQHTLGLGGGGGDDDDMLLFVECCLVARINPRGQITLLEEYLNAPTTTTVAPSSSSSQP